MTTADSSTKDLYFVFMDYDPEYERMRSKSSKDRKEELDLYLSKKHDSLLANVLEQGTYTKRFSRVIVDGFGVEITTEQANRLRSAEGVRLVDKNLEFCLRNEACDIKEMAVTPKPRKVLCNLFNIMSKYLISDAIGTEQLLV